MSIGAPSEMIRKDIATHNAASPVGVEAMVGKGVDTRTGQAVQVAPSAADMTDALEELGMAAATRGKGDLDKLRLRKSQGSNFEALGRIADYYDKLPDMPSEDAHRDLRRRFDTYERIFRDGTPEERSAAQEEMQRELEAFDGDISHRFAALEILRDQAARSGAAPGFLQAIDRMRRDMRTPETTRAIMAGFAAARGSQEVADKLGVDPSDYRQSYRTLIGGMQHMGQVFSELRKYSPSQSAQFEQVVESFLKTAGEDMASFGPSTEPAQLSQVVAELKTLKALRSVMDMAAKLVAQVAQLHPPPPDSRRPSGDDLTQRLLNYAANPAASYGEAMSLLQGFTEEGAAVAVNAINPMLDLHGALPAPAVHSDDARVQQKAVLVRVADHWAAKEEETYAG